MHVYLIKTKPEILFLYLVAYTLLLIGYDSFIVPTYGYTGYECALNRVKALEALLAIIFIALILPSGVKRPTDFFSRTFSVACYSNACYI